jgi:hypothetical protein
MKTCIAITSLVFLLSLAFSTSTRRSFRDVECECTCFPGKDEIVKDYIRNVNRHLARKTGQFVGSLLDHESICNDIGVKDQIQTIWLEYKRLLAPTVMPKQLGIIETRSKASIENALKIVGFCCSSNGYR